MSLIRNLIESVFGRINADKAVVENVRQECFTLENTKPLDQEITIGPRCSTLEVEKSNVLTQVFNLIKTGKAGRLSFHFDNKWNVDLVVKKAYFLRKDQSGMIVEVLAVPPTESKDA